MRTASFLIVLLLIPAPPGRAQTAATATLSGSVSDESGAVLKGATVSLIDPATNTTRTSRTNDDGQYVFTSIAPGTYKITVSMAGFKQAQTSGFKVDVAKGHGLDFHLSVGQVTEIVEVAAGSGAELQKVDSTIGNELKGELLVRLPNLTRSAVAFYTLQPLTMPYRGVQVGDNEGGQVAGARSDQSTFSLDGADITDNTVGTHPVKPSGIGVEPIIPVPVDSIEEFRVGTTNPNATFGRSSGAQISFLTKRGTNSIHGSAYLYHQNDALNADTWNRKRLGRKPDGTQVLPEPELKDNRFGFSVGGPIWANRTFIFGLYEGRRFPSSVDVLRIVPTPSLRSGVLRFRDAGNSVVSYNLANSTACGPAAASACDPRRIGLNPVVNDLWQFMPAGNDPTVGDGLNTIGFRSTASAATNSDFAVARLDHNFTDKWRFDGSYRYSRQTALSPTQIDIGGLLEGDALGKASSLGKVPVQPRFVVGGLTGQLTSTMVNEFRFSFQRNYWFIQRTTPFPQVPSTNVSVQVAGAAAAAAGLLDQPIDVHTQLARIQGVNDRIFQYIDNLTWVKGSHNLNFGASFRRLNLYHLRNDKVVGSLSALVAELDDGQAVSIPGTNRPRDCSSTVTTNCLQSGDVTRWNRLYAGALGMIDNIGAMIVRDGTLTPKAIGTPIEIDAKVNAYEFYINDAWRFKPSLTLTLGLSYQWQTPPVEKEGKQTFLIDQATGEIITSKSYLAARRQAAEAGDVFNPNLAFQPINDSKRKTIFDIDRKNLGPRLAAAWNPSFQDGWLGSLFGDKKTVVRGGYSLVFDRLNTVQTVVIPALGVGFAQTVNCRGPRIGGACGNSNDPTNAFRIGVDGAAPIPPIPVVTSPVVPTVPFGELLSFQVDPDIGVGRSHSIDLSIQRELFGKFVLEFGYTGRIGQNLNQNVQINAVPFFMKDKASGQTFAQAFDAVAAQVRANAAVTPQPWFENQIGPGGTSSLAGSQAAAFRDGLLSDLWTTIQFTRPAGPIGNLQVLDLWMRTDGGRSNYNAFFVTLRRRFSGGLTFDVNYTLSRARDQAGLIQNFIGTFSSPYDPDIDYGPAFFDRTHVLNANWFYELPLGSAGRWSFKNPLDKLISGWFVSGIYTTNSGLPLTVAQSNQVWGGDPLNFSVAAGAIPKAKLNLGNSIHHGVKGSAGIGTNSNPATGGTGLNLFTNPEAAFNAFRKIRISEDGRQGSGVLRGLSRWNIDISVGKKTQIGERIRTIFSADFLNLTNRLELNDPVLSLQNPAAFGVLTTQFNAPRRIQLGFRVEF